jgi:hypothetical protein
MSFLGTLANKVTDTYHERRLGITTSGLIVPNDFGDESGECYPYLGMSYRALKRIFDHIDVDPGRDVLVDYGSGLGRVPLYAASFYPFKRVVGVELSKSLHDVAVVNGEKAKPKLMCKDIEFIQADARDYAVPGDVTVIYFFMPFGADILTKVLENIRESARRTPRKIRLFYVNPPWGISLATVVANLPWVKITSQEPFSPYYGFVRAMIDG